MRKSIISLAAGLLLFAGCVDLDLNPLTEGSSENWFSNAQEIEMALNELYGEDSWYFDAYRMGNSDRWTDDWNQREYVYDYLKGEVSSTWGDTKSHYQRFYKTVARANTVLASIDNAKGVLTPEQIDQYRGEAAFFRAVAYSYLTFLYGDVPFYTEWISLKEAYDMGKTDKAKVLEQVNADFDLAIKNLPSSYSGVRRITRGMAYAFKARTALWNSDWQTCKEAAKGCIATGEFELEKDFEKAVSTDTKTSKEFIFFVPRSTSMEVVSKSMKSMVPRVLGGNATAQPSLECFCSFLCTDGKTIDKSSVYDPLNPYENRDPRLKATFVVPGETLLGTVIDPRPWIKKVMNRDGNEVSNKDTRTVDQYAAYNGLNLKKGITEDWIDDFTHDGSVVIMRYSDVWLMLAEAKCELGEIDDEAREAINRVRARAYGVDYKQVSRYPSVTTSDQAEFRTNLRIERRMEFVFENHRFFDVIRWKIAEKALTKPMVGLDIAKLKAADASNWFFSADIIPEVDKDGVVDMKPFLGKNCFYQVAFSNFDATKQYLFPFPADEILSCPNIIQNENY